MFGLWPDFDAADAPIGSITNGVHAPTWVAREVFELARSVGARPSLDPDAGGGTIFDVVEQVAAVDLWPPSGPCVSASSPTPAGGSASPGSSGAPRAPSWAGSTRCSTPTS